MKGRVLACWLMAWPLLAVAACSDSSVSRRACPPKGLGVEEFEGIKPAQQVEEYRQYSCAQPQICPDIGAPTSQLYVVVPDCEISGDCPPPAQVNRTLTNCSSGTAKLVIERIVIYGDSRCTFTETQSEDNKTAMGGDESLTIKTDWKPTTTGEDHAQFRIYSNAQNFPELILPFCGRAVLQSDLRPAGADGGVGNTDASQGSDTGTGIPALQCQPSTTVNKQCHSEQ